MLCKSSCFTGTNNVSDLTNVDDQETLQLAEKLRNIINSNSFEHFQDLIGIDLLRTISKHLFDCYTAAQLNLLEAVEQIAFKGKTIHNFNQRQFLENITLSGLEQNIENLLERKYKLYKKKSHELPYSGAILKLHHLFFWIMRNKQLKQCHLQRYQNILIKNIEYIAKILKQTSTDIKMKKYKENSDTLENMLKVGIDTIYPMKYSAQGLQAQIFYLNCSNISEILIPLLHINCNPQLNCNHNITIPDSPILQKFQSEIIISQSSQQIHSSNIKETLILKHNILCHIHLSLLAQQQHSTPQQVDIRNIDINKNTITQQVNLSNSFLTQTFTDYLQQYNFISSLLAHYNPNKKTSPIILKFFQMICKLIYSNISSSQLKENILKSLKNISKYSKPEMLQLIIESGYISIFSYIIAQGGGNREDNIQLINQGFENVWNFQLNIRGNAFSPVSPVIRKIYEEKLESEGIDSEIDSHMFLTPLIDQFNIKQNIFITRTQMMNRFKDKSNRNRFEL